MSAPTPESRLIESVIEKLAAAQTSTENQIRAGMVAMKAFADTRG